MKPKFLLWFLPIFLALFLVTVGVVLFFSHIYQTTQKLKSQTQMSLYPEIDLKIIPAISQAMETMAVSSSSQALSPQEIIPKEILQRQATLKQLAVQFPKAHALYTARCLSCHGTIAQGGKALANLSTRMNPRKSTYTVPPLRAGNISSNLDEFFTAASKRNSPHLPQNLLAAEKQEVLELQRYLKELVNEHSAH